jgi:hypothetical protein
LPHSNSRRGKGKKRTVKSQPQSTGVTDRVVKFVRGDETKYAPKPRTSGYFSRPVAPVTWPVLLGVCALVTVMLGFVAAGFTNDYVRAFGCFLVIMAGAAVVDGVGRKRAEKHPDPRYRPDKLPVGAHDNRLKAILGFTTICLLVGYVTGTASAGTYGSPMPYFLAAEFLILVMPQLVAWRAMRVSSPTASKKSQKKSSKK